MVGSCWHKFSNQNPNKTLNTMNRNLLKIASLALSTNRNLLFTPKIIHTPIYTTSSLYKQTPLSFLNLRCFNSKNSENPGQLPSDSGSGRPESPDGEDVSKEGIFITFYCVLIDPFWFVLVKM